MYNCHSNTRTRLPANTDTAFTKRTAPWAEWHVSATRTYSILISVQVCRTEHKSTYVAKLHSLSLQLFAGASRLTLIWPSSLGNVHIVSTRTAYRLSSGHPSQPISNICTCSHVAKQVLKLARTGQDWNRLKKNTTVLQCDTGCIYNAETKL